MWRRLLILPKYGDRLRDPQFRPDGKGTVCFKEIGDHVACPRISRWIAFNSVGAMGMLVQLSVLYLLADRFGWNYLLSTVLAVEASVLHNFIWHVHWTWADHTRCDKEGMVRRFLYFNFTNGALSIVGNLLLMRLLVGTWAMNYTVANLLAIGICSTLNFFASDRIVFRQGVRESTAHPILLMLAKNRDRLRRPRACTSALFRELQRARDSVGCHLTMLVAAVWMGTGIGAHAAELRPETVRAWQTYIQATEQRIVEELGSNRGFLALEFQPVQAATAERQAVLAGEIRVTKMRALAPKGEQIHVPEGMIHHWRGSVFIPGILLDDVLSRVANPATADTRQEDVLESKVLERGPDSLKLYLKLQRSKLVTVVYNTEHQIRYGRYGEFRASSRSAATKIAELENPNSEREREKPEGRDRGFLWRLNSYWRYVQVDGGVIVECESATLSRTLPAFLEHLIRPLIDSVARESMKRTLGSMRDRLARKQSLAQILADSSAFSDLHARP